jgi:hypothetical protein
MTDLTTAEAAALLVERGYGKRTHKQHELTADAVKRMCYRGVFPDAYLVKRGGGRGYWLIPLSDIDTLVPPKSS